MGLPASQQRILDRIEEALRHREPRLASMFSIFNRLNLHERLPWIEALERVPWWSPRRYRTVGRARAAVLLTLATALVVAGVFAGISRSPAGCNTPIMLRGPLIGVSHVRNCPAQAQAKADGHSR